MTGGYVRFPASWWRQARRFLDKAVHVVFPSVCVSCRSLGSLLCDECRAQLTWLREPLCPTCSRPLNHGSSVCLSCRRDPLPLVQIRAVADFDGPLREAIHSLKYHGMFGVADVLSQLMASEWREWYSPIDLVLPIPLHAERERERGYNQAALLVNGFCRELGLERDLQAMRRVRNTRPQVGLDWAQRRSNVEGAFSVERNRVAGKHILLVDDVCTTGATLAAAATTLLENGARSVSAYCLARPIGGS